ncbi:MAG: HlyD family efflux transporter periplasmic adaptor subunit [Clostridia bacterium]|nr:HlyD family efflux transporter periplasmic adaptor subunit [Clostridia bacterium]
MKKLFALMLVFSLVLTVPSAFAASLSLNGTVVNVGEQTILSARGGTVDTVLVQPGQRVEAGETLALIQTKKVYAKTDGVVRLFGEVGDTAEMVTEQYGAVAYIEPLTPYIVQASTKTADAAEDNKFVHPGTTVYLRAVENMNHTGTGTVTSVSGGSFTVVLSSGLFDKNDTANVYRDPNFIPATRLGKGSVSLVDPVAYTAEGVIAAYAVEDGAKVKKGDVLFETLDGDYQGAGVNLTAILCPVKGTIVSLNVSKGNAISAGGAVASIYPDEALRIQAPVSESDVAYLRQGDAVTAEFFYLNNGAITVRGTIESISRIGEASADSETDEASYMVTITPTSTAGLYYGAHAIVSLAQKTDGYALTEEENP